jgi:hypothetical protein
MNKRVDPSEQDFAKVMLERDVLRADVERLTRLLAKAERQLAARARSCRLYGCHFERARKPGYPTASTERLLPRADRVLSRTPPRLLKINP